MFAPDFGVPEDPATGSAAAAFAGVVHRFDELPDGTHKRIIEQGFEMGRPSLIDLSLEMRARQARMRCASAATRCAWRKARSRFSGGLAGKPPPLSSGSRVPAGVRNEDLPES